MSDLARVVFLHLTKAGGTTLRAVLRRLYRDTLLEIGPDTGAAIAALDALPEPGRERVRAVAGHVAYGVHRHLPGAWTTITLVRHPVERLLSHYGYTLRTPGSPLYRQVVAAGMGLREYVGSHALAPLINNGQVRLLGGDADLRDGAATEAHLERAIGRLRDGSVRAGITERFDSSLWGFAIDLGWRRTPFYRPIKVAPQRILREEIDGETLRAILEANALDLELHRVAAERLQASIEARGPGFADRVDRFQRMNRARLRAFERTRPMRGLARPLRSRVRRWRSRLGA